MTRPILLAIAALLAPTIGLLATVAPARGATTETRQPITVGNLQLTPCHSGYGSYCGSITRPLDPSGHQPGTLTIGFEWYPRRAQNLPPLGTIVAQEGGPGYSTTGSRDGYVRLFDPLRDRRDILLMDKRGTGTSGVLRCPSLQIAGSATPADYAECGRKLGPNAWFYASRFAADDLAALLDQLGRHQVDYYGDSYATFFGQVFARRHPDYIRTLVLDSAYPDGGPFASPWFQTEYATTYRALRTVCARSPACASLGGDPVQRLNRLVAAIRRTPITGTAPNASGGLSQVTIDPPTLFMVFDLAGNSQILWRDVDAATRAWFDRGDSLPLLRLVAESLDSNGLGKTGSFEFSNALATAVICADYPQPFDPRLTPAARRVQYDAALRRKQKENPGIYAPFTIAEAIAAPYQPLEIGVCLDWPSPPPDAGPHVPHGPAPAVTTLVANGELDTVTSEQEGRVVAHMFAGSTYLVVPNAIHEVAVGDAGEFVPPFGGDLARCAGPIVLQFVQSSGQADTSCLRHMRPIRSPAAFVLHAGQTVLPASRAGNTADVAHLHAASAATEAVGDVIARYFQQGTNHGRGLRGGTFAFYPTKTGYVFHIDGDAWTEDIAISGTINWNQKTGDILAKVDASGISTGSLTISWNDRETNATAMITGRLDGQTVTAQRIAP